MKGSTILFAVGWCGFGWDGGLLPELRLGIVRFAWCRGWPFEKYRAALAAAEGLVRGIGA